MKFKLTKSKYGGSLKNNNASSRKYAIIFGIFALVIVTTAASYAFFTYSRVGETTTTITSGDIEFSYIEGDSASLANAFPVSDLVGAQDTTEEYTFDVKMNSSSNKVKMNYNVYLLDDNDEENVNYFTNEQIKFSLVKNGTYVAGTSSTLGLKLSSIAGFTEGGHQGEGLVLANQEITSSVTDNYKLRIWISDDVNYSNTDEVTKEDENTSIGKYNGYKYSLKVKVTSDGVESLKTINSLNVTNLTMTAELEDSNGLSAYAVTNSKTAPENGSSEWISLTTTAKSNVVRTSTVTTKIIEVMVKKNGTHYLHVKNANDEVATKSFTTNAVGEKATTKIMNLATTNTNELRIDEHAATGQQSFEVTEYRYYGKTPNNYVWFNNELWRIIGAFDVDDGSKGIDEVGNVEKRLKIIRANPIGSYSWDSSDSSINQGNGINEWSQADLMTLLNFGPYYNRTTGTCFVERNNKTAPCDFTKIGLTDDAKEMIGNTKWYLGTRFNHEPYTEEMYRNERGTVTSKQCTQNTTDCSDSVTRKKAWVGEVGLIYPSDYGYSATQQQISSTKLHKYTRETWLYLPEISQKYDNAYWLLTPQANNSILVFQIYYGGGHSSSMPGIAYNILPATYLKHDVKILDGNGTTSKPFVLSN